MYLSVFHLTLVLRMAAASDWFLSPGRAEARDARSCSVDGRMLCSTAVQNLPGLLYDNMKGGKASPWPGLLAGPAGGARGDVLEDGDVESGTTLKRLDLQSIMRHFRKKDAAGTFAASVCSLALSDGTSVRMVYVIPKYILSWTTERRPDTDAVLALSLAQSVEDVQAACAAPETGRLELLNFFCWGGRWSGLILTRQFLDFFVAAQAWFLRSV